MGFIAPAIGIAKGAWDLGKGIVDKLGGAKDVMGMAAQAGNIYQGFQDQRTQGQNYDQQNARYGQLQQMIQQQMGMNGPSGGELGLSGMLGGMLQPQNYNPMQVQAGQVDPSMFGGQSININQLGNQGFNQSQDALMQMINRGAGGQLGVAGKTLEDLSMNGGQQGVDDLLGAMGKQQDMSLERNLAQSRASAGSLGRMAGTAQQFTEGRIRNEAQAQNNTLNAQTRLSGMNSAQDRRMAAASALGGYNLQGGSQQIGAAGQLGQLGLGMSGQNLQALLANQQSGLQGQGMSLQAMLANQGTGLQAGQANQQAGLSANSQNNQAMQAFIQQQLAGYQGLGGLQQGRMGQNNNLLALLAGLQQPNAPMGSPFVDALTQAPVLNTVYDRLNRPQGASPTIMSSIGTPQLPYAMPQMQWRL